MSQNKKKKKNTIPESTILIVCAFFLLSLPLSAVFPCLSWLDANISLKRATIHLPGNFHHSQVQQNDPSLKKKKGGWGNEILRTSENRIRGNDLFRSGILMKTHVSLFTYERHQKTLNIGWLILRCYAFFVFVSNSACSLFSFTLRMLLFW